MRVLFCELRKLFSSGIFIFIVLAAVILNLYLCFSAKPVGVSDEQYQAFFEELESVPDNEKTAVINAKVDELYNGEFTIETMEQRGFLLGELE